MILFVNITIRAKYVWVAKSISVASWMESSMEFYNMEQALIREKFNRLLKVRDGMSFSNLTAWRSMIIFQEIARVIASVRRCE